MDKPGGKNESRYQRYRRNHGRKTWGIGTVPDERTELNGLVVKVNEIAGTKTRKDAIYVALNAFVGGNVK